MATESHEEEEASEGEGEGGRKIGGKKLIIILVAMAALVGGGVALYFSGLLPFGKKGESSASHEEKKEESGEEKSKDGEKGEHDDKKAEATGGPAFLDIPPFLVNLNTASTQGSGKSSFLKVTVTLELASAEDTPKLEAMLPRVVDNFNTYLRELRPADLAGSAGITRLREELLLRVNKAAYPIQVKDILFREMLVQ